MHPGNCCIIEDSGLTIAAAILMSDHELCQIERTAAQSSLGRKNNPIVTDRVTAQIFFRRIISVVLIRLRGPDSA